jgi:hypothetical protein
MKIIFSLFAFFLLTASCTPILLISESEFNEIPENSTKVVVTTNYSADSLYKTIALILANNGYDVNENKTALQIYTNPKSLERSNSIKCRANITITDAGTLVNFSGDYGLNAEGQMQMQAFTGRSYEGFLPIKFTKNTSQRADYCFQHLILLAKEIKGGVISYK